MEVHEALGHTQVTAQEALVEGGGKLQRLLELCETEEQPQQPVAIHESTKELTLEDGQRREVVKNWLNLVQETVAPLTDIRLVGIVKRARP